MGLINMVLDVINAIAGFMTAIGVILVFVQMHTGARKDRQNFEDGFVKEYRELIAALPMYALLGKSPLTPLTDSDLLPFYRYFDLCNQQAFMFEKNRIGEEVWADWLDGIKDNLSMPAFAEAWRVIKDQRNDSFSELRRLESKGFRF
ncbi:MAG: hypothetical protein K2W85_12980 [Phycisphaerales bacterium]|nr:hypothetical protein [Phycisphaerales bacterium]